MTIRKKALGLTAVAVAAALALAGCSSTGGAAELHHRGRPGLPRGGSGRRWRSADTPNYTIAMITHETPGRHVLGQDPVRRARPRPPRTTSH